MKKKLDSYDIDKKLKPVLRQMEKLGVKIDLKYIAKLNAKISYNIEKIKKEIFSDLGSEVNLNSPSQLSEMLYKKIGIKAQGKRGKTHYSTSHEALEKIADEHVAIKKILSYRELAKLKSTYIDPLPKLIGDDGRIHTHYAVDTSTGRLSSKRPNLQNIPTRTQIGKEIKKAFVAREGYKLLKVDYSQIQLRIAAHLSDDKNMLKLFQNDGDIHAKTAHELHCDRRTAKVVNFGVLYGMSAYGLSETLKISQKEAQYFIDKYFDTYQGIKKYSDEIVSKALKDGYVESLFGRRREISEIVSKNPRLVNFGKRAAINTPIQATEAEIVKLAMIVLSKQLTANSKQQKMNDAKTSSASQKLNTDCQMILQVHDELVFEVKKEKVKKFAKKIKDVMENVVKLKVPVKVDVSVGDNWEETRKMEIGKE